MLNFSGLSSTSVFGKLLRLPLALLPPEVVVRIVQGPLRGKRWIVGSGLHGYWLGSFEFKKQRLIASQVKPGTVFYDIGANVGFYTLLASTLVEDGKVFAFEPLPRNVGYLRRHLALNRVTNVEVLQAAVLDTVGMASFQEEATHHMGHLGNLQAGDSCSVATVTLDSLLEQGRIAPPDYIKMDIEGGELLALQGARRCFERYKPALYLATHGREVHGECCRLLQSWGYEPQALDGATLEHATELIACFRPGAAGCSTCS